MLAALLEASSAIQAKLRPVIFAPIEQTQPESIKNLKAERNKAEDTAKRSRYAAEQAKLAELELRQRYAIQLEANVKERVEAEALAEGTPRSIRPCRTKVPG